MDRGGTVMLRYFAQLIHIGHTHILFDHEVFKIELLFKCKETMSTFCSTSVNTVYQSLKTVLPELSSQINIFQSEVNGHQKTNIDFLCSNFHQINDNVATMKNDVAQTTTISDMQVFFKYCSRYEKGSN